MDNDKAFAAYVLVLVAGVTSMITTSLMAGFATLPSPVTFVEHLSLSLLFRFAYKSFGGFDWSEWAVTSDAVTEPTATAEQVASSGATAH